MSYKINFIVIFIISFFWSCKQKDIPKYAKNELFELAPPQVTIDSSIFKNTASVIVNFETDGAKIHYTSDGSNVDESSKSYENPLLVKQSGKYNFKVFHPEYRPSKQISATVIKINQNISDAEITTEPNPHQNYKGEGINSLTDLKKGSTQFRNGNYWLGFLSPTTTLNLKFKQPLSISKIVLSTLKDHNSWIFSPKSILAKSNSKNVGATELESPHGPQSTQLDFIEIPIKKNKYSQIDLQLTMENIPEWHQGKGTVPFFFIDEILVE